VRPELALPGVEQLPRDGRARRVSDFSQPGSLVAKGGQGVPVVGAEPLHGLRVQPLVVRSRGGSLPGVAEASAGHGKEIVIPLGGPQGLTGVSPELLARIAGPEVP
jgi:hypothetical protein